MSQDHQSCTPTFHPSPGHDDVRLCSHSAGQFFYVVGVGFTPGIYTDDFHPCRLPSPIWFTPRDNNVEDSPTQSSATGATVAPTHSASKSAAANATDPAATDPAAPPTTNLWSVRRAQYHAKLQAQAATSSPIPPVVPWAKLTTASLPQVPLSEAAALITVKVLVNTIIANRAARDAHRAGTASPAHGAVKAVQAKPVPAVSSRAASVEEVEDEYDIEWKKRTGEGKKAEGTEKRAGSAPAPPTSEGHRRSESMVEDEDEVARRKQRAEGKKKAKQVEEKDEEEEDEDSDSDSEDEEEGDADKPPRRVPGNTHRARNPDMPTQPASTRAKKTGPKADAEVNTAGLKGASKKAALARLAERTDVWFEEQFEKDAAAIAEECGVSVKDARTYMLQHLRHKGKGEKRGYNAANAKYWDWCERWKKDHPKKKKPSMKRNKRLMKKEGKEWTEEMLEDLKVRFLAARARKIVGTRGMNMAAAADAGHVANAVQSELKLLEKRSGSQSFFMVVGGDIDDTAGFHTGGTDSAEEFLVAKYQTDGIRFAKKINAFCCNESGDGAGDAPPGKSDPCRAEVVQMILEKLRAATGNPGQTMHYKAFKQAITVKYGVDVVGWPEGVPFDSLSNGSKGMADDGRKLWNALKDGTLQFVKLGDKAWDKVKKEVAEEVKQKKEERKEEKKRKQKKAAKKSKKVDSDEEEEAQETEEETADEEEVQKKKSKKPKRKVVEVEEEEEEEHPRKKQKAATKSSAASATAATTSKSSAAKSKAATPATDSAAAAPATKKRKAADHEGSAAPSKKAKKAKEVEAGEPFRKARKGKAKEKSKPTVDDDSDNPEEELPRLDLAEVLKLKPMERSKHYRRAAEEEKAKAQAEAGSSKRRAQPKAVVKSKPRTLTEVAQHGEASYSEGDSSS
ncbi:hypothetical protein R3P38DRAFT_3205090 [Favolaschia claudopus]|uniref:Uncharacterized protein n=1 Tax=Favolaschia claudopus TaxID=2862362 RepID=A0AAW0ARJ9_9AGAR